MVIEGQVWSSAGQSAAWSEWGAISAPMLQTLDVAPALLKWTRSDGVALQRLVRLADGLDPPIEGGGAWFEYQAQFFAEDPKALSQTLTTVTGASLSSGGGFTAPFDAPFTADAGAAGTVAVNNLGNRPTSPIFRVYGYAVNPVITLTGSGKAITLDGTIAPGDYVELDVQARTLTLNGTSPVSDLLNSAATRWFELPSGASTIQLTAGAFDASTRCDVLFRSAYV